MFPSPVLVKQGKKIHIGVRFQVGDDFFCQTHWGYSGKAYRDLFHFNGECNFDVVESD